MPTTVPTGLLASLLLPLSVVVLIKAPSQMLQIHDMQSASRKKAPFSIEGMRCVASSTPAPPK
jgi:hypothetical protein